MQETKDKIQRAGLNKWYTSKCRGTLQYATGVGKSRCGVLAAEHFAKKYNYEFRTLILTPTETIRDIGWPDEFKKWGAEETFLKTVEVMCINTARKLSGEKFDLVIADEIHNYMSPENYKFFVNNSFRGILGLSAFIDAEHKFLLNRVAPIIDSIDLFDAVKHGLVSQFHIINLGVNPDNEFWNEYNRFTDTITSYGVRGYKAPWKTINARKDLIYKASEKVDTAIELVKMMEDKKLILFSLTADIARDVKDKLEELYPGQVGIHHSKMKKKERLNTILNFNNPEHPLRIISTVKTLDEGVNLTDVDAAIVIASTSKMKSWIQRVGRCIRFKEGKKAFIVRLVINDTVDEKWAWRSQTDFIVNRVKSLTSFKALYNTDNQQIKV